MDTPFRRRWFSFGNTTAASIAVFLPALLIRLLGIVSRPIWYDEAFAILFSEKGLKAMLAGTLTVGPGGAAADIHPLAYYTLLWGWMKVFGESLVSVRMLSILLGVGTVVLAYYLLRTMFPAGRLALVGALGVALAPFLVHFSQEVRMYALLALSLTAATFASGRGCILRRCAGGCFSPFALPSPNTPKTLPRFTWFPLPSPRLLSVAGIR